MTLPGRNVFPVLSVALFAVLAFSTSSVAGETLYNGVELPDQWPPRHLDAQTRAVQPVPYLKDPPAVIPIEVGRQLFVDDFLIEQTTLQREFHQPIKYDGNPILKPETDLEMKDGRWPAACPFSDGCFYDPQDQRFKLWYHAGFMDSVALAISQDGVHWQRPQLDVVEGTNRVVAQRDDFTRDGVSVWLDHLSGDPAERFKMFHYARSLSQGEAGYLLTSPDGVHWTWRGRTGPTYDNTTFFYNPFRKKWCFSHRSIHRMRTRDYWENENFFAALDDWDGFDPVFWAGADELDLPHPKIGDETQIYKIDAVAYESLMLGLLQVHYGPINDVCAADGIPKLTELKVAFSRDGFHWDRSARQTFIGATLEKDNWERSYIHPCGGVCLVVGEKLYFYYGGFQGDQSNRPYPVTSNAMYANSSTGMAVLRRDGFASMNAPQEDSAEAGTLTTRPVTFPGKYLLVNVDCPEGELRAEVLDEEGNPIESFTAANCRPVSTDSTLQRVTWQDVEDLSAVAGRPVRLRFHLKRGKLYAFWVSPEESGASYGYVGAGGPGFTGPTDDAGVRAYADAKAVSHASDVTDSPPRRESKVSPPDAARRKARARQRRLILDDDGDVVYEIAPDAGPEELLSIRYPSWLHETPVDSVAWCQMWGIAHLGRSSDVRYWQNQMEGAPLTSRVPDPTPVVADHCRRHDIEVFGSLRMNDTHDAQGIPFPKLLYPLKVKHPEFLLGDESSRHEFALTSHDAWTWSGLDYAHPEVREDRFWWMDHTASHYDLDGVDLNFFRMPWYFKTGQEERHMPLMTELVRRARRRFDEIGRRRGRTMLLGVRVPATPLLCRKIGLDIETWLAEGLIDRILTGTPGVPFSTPAEQLIELGHRHGVPVYPCINCQDNIFANPEALRGAAANLWHAGADGLYLWNFHYIKTSQHPYGQPLKEDYDLLSEIGEPKRLVYLDKIFAVDCMENNFVYSQATFPGPLPLRVTRGPADPHLVPVRVGDNIKAAADKGRINELSLGLKFDVRLEKHQLAVRLNGQPLVDGIARPDDSKWIDFKLQPAIVQQGVNRLEVAMLEHGAEPGALLEQVWVTVGYRN